MKNLLLQYKPFFIFLIKFLLLYIGLTVGYKCYLSQYDAQNRETDGITKAVASQVEKTLLFLNQEASAKPNPTEASVNILLHNKSVVRVVEGCNAVSIMILFAAFIFAFSSRWLKTGLYIVIGILLIHILNVIRIALITIALNSYPEQEHLLHGVIFPLFIYGVVFVLWVLWVQKFSGYAKKTIGK
ncbi:exosortase family protein XrtF [Flavobacterium inviolabile]|uniref:exosortase family protein XrtF n=1 Tax=Flavobacterium inviolabile TaxID=2748320 RepID=UPI001FE9FAE2|nr:exosortase family protein XrtF [Flavobacterium inviolabile]